MYFIQLDSQTYFFSSKQDLEMTSKKKKFVVFESPLCFEESTFYGTQKVV